LLCTGGQLEEPVWFCFTTSTLSELKICPRVDLADRVHAVGRADQDHVAIVAHPQDRIADRETPAERLVGREQPGVGKRRHVDGPAAIVADDRADHLEIGEEDQPAEREQHVLWPTRRVADRRQVPAERGREPVQAVGEAPGR
jgi:hypothetical protein